MFKRKVKLYQACIARDLNLSTIANLAGIETTRFSRILTGEREATIKEKRKLSKILRQPQKNLF